MATRFDIQNGMIVRSSDGEKLGKIVSFDANSFIVEKGFFFPKEYQLSVADISEIRADEIWLRLPKDALLHGEGWATHEKTAVADKPLVGDTHLGKEHLTHAKADVLGKNEELRVPLAEEELRVHKEMQQAGSVKIHKDVVTEQKTVSVPVTREVVRVERVPASGAVHASASAFKEETIDVPLREERAVFDKDVVVREELRVTKEAVQDQASATETLRRETADVREEGNVVRQDASLDTNIGGYSKDRTDYDQGAGTTLDNGRFEQSPTIGGSSNLNDPLKRKL